MPQQAPTPPSHTNSPSLQHFPRQLAFVVPQGSGQPSPSAQILPSPDPSEDGLRRSSSGPWPAQLQSCQSQPLCDGPQSNQLKRPTPTQYPNPQAQKRMSLDGAPLPTPVRSMSGSFTLPSTGLGIGQPYAPSAVPQMRPISDPPGQEPSQIDEIHGIVALPRALQSPSLARLDTSPASQAASPQVAMAHSSRPSEYLLCAQSGYHGLVDQLISGKLHPLVQARIKTLLEAIKCDDAAFLFLHQIVCLHFCQPEQVPVALTDVTGFTSVVSFLSGLLGHPERLSKQTLKFFACFPQSLQYFAPRSQQGFASQVLSLRTFFTDMASGGVNYLTRFPAISRYPPSMAEIFGHTGARSVTLRAVIFRCMGRTIWSKFLPDSAVLELLHLTEGSQKQDEVAFRRRQSQGSQLISFDEKRANQAIHQIVNQMIEMCDRWPVLPSPMSVPSGVAPEGAAGPSRPATAVARGPAHPGLTVSTTAGLQPMPQIPATAINRAQNPAVRTTRPNPGFDLSFFPQGPYTPTQVAEPQPTHALHQLWCRTPPPELQMTSKIEPSKPSSQELCQVINGFVAPPRLLRPNEIIHNFKFFLDDNNIKTLYQDSVTSDGNIRRHYKEGMRSVRVKISNKAFKPQSQAEFRHHASDEWVTADCYWPQNMLIEVNQKPLELRRKLHWAKDIPVDITGNDLQGNRYLRPGQNVIEVLFTTGHEDPTIGRYSFAVEMIDTISAATLKTNTRNQVQAAAVTLGIITKKLGTDGDDELQSVGGTITLDLFEPFTTSKIFAIPVRSKHCQHLDCFDLDTFIDARYRRKPGYPSAVDDWKCPLCRADSRPRNLFVDQFFVDIRKRLKEMNKLDTRYVSVNADGTWEPKQQKKKDRENNGTMKVTGDGDDGGRKADDQKNAAAAVGVVAAPPKVVEVIELDD